MKQLRLKPIQNYPVYFFTEDYVKISNYCLLNIKKYNSNNLESKKIIFIDPSVYELKNNTEYSNIDFMKNLIIDNKLNYNEFISIDYPPDMDLSHSYLFKKKSIQNNILFAKRLDYICTIQSNFKDFNDFIKEWNFLKNHNAIDFSKKIIGIGNLCRLIKRGENEIFINSIFSFLRKEIPKCDIKWIHFYGLPKWIIKKWIERISRLCIVSIDSTKWTRDNCKEDRKKYGHMCGIYHDEFFLTYMKQLKPFIPSLKW